MTISTSFRIKLGILAALGLNALSANAQTAPTWDSVWRSSAPNATSYGSGRSIALAADGSRYVTGEFVGTLTLGPVTLTAGAGASHLFVAKYSAAGVVLWARQLDGGGSALPIHVAADASGNAYLVGGFYNTITLGTATLTSPGPDSYLVKFDAQGGTQWVVQGGAGTYFTSIATDAAGNVALAGYSGATAALGGPALAGVGICYYKLSPAGAVVQAVRVASGAGFSSETALTLDGAGNAYIGGSFSGSPAFGGTVLASPGSFDIYLCKLNATGTIAWARSVGGANDDNIGGVAVDATGNVLMCGSSAYVFPGNGTPSGSMLYVARFSTQGAPLWSQQLGPTYTGSGGPGTANSYTSGVAYDGRGGYLVTGQLAGTVTLGTNVLTSASPQAFVARFDGQGNVVWADRAVGTSANARSTGIGIAADASGRAYVLGTAAAAVAFGTVATTPPASGQGDIFVAELAAGGVLATRASAQTLVLETYPNPAAGSATVLLPVGGGSLKLLDALGRVVRTQELPQAVRSCVLSLAGLAPGLYQVQATLGNGQLGTAQLAVE